MTATQEGTPERTIGQLVADATRDLSTIVRGEIQLAKTELASDAKKAGLGAGMLAVAGVMSFLAVILLLFAAVYGLVAGGLSVWLSFLIIGAALLLVGGVFGFVGKQALGKVKGKPARTIKSTQDTIAAIKPGR